MAEEADLGPRELARLTGVSTDTLRHYERMGLLRKVARTPSGYRRYPRETVSRVLLIQRALVVGFSLGELKRVLGERDKGGAPCHSVRMLVSARLEDLDRQLEELTALRADLLALAGEWDARLERTPPGHQAHLLDSLAGRPLIDRARTQRAGAPAAKDPKMMRRFLPRRRRS
jgi:DNA-binding transcriptional MerR regulator